MQTWRLALVLLTPLYNANVSLVVLCSPHVRPSLPSIHLFPCPLAALPWSGQSCSMEGAGETTRYCRGSGRGELFVISSFQAKWAEGGRRGTELTSAAPAVYWTGFSVGRLLPGH